MKKEWIFIMTLSAIIICGSAWTVAYGGADEIKAMLLRPGGWTVEWRGASEGVSDFLFEDRGGKIIVKIETVAWNMSCERDVTITSEAVKFDACYDTGVTLNYDPDDKEYPFKGESQKVNYKLKAK